jgi:hypothetical protein
MIDREFDAIEYGDIERLVRNGVPEGRSLDYKETLPGNSDSDRREFLGDLSSLANTVGGDVVYGVGEQRDTNGKPTGVPAFVVGLSVANRDAELLRLESIVRDGLAPRVAGIHFRWLDGTPGAVLVVRVPRSWSGPHMVIFQQLSRFYARAANGKYLLDVLQLREAFLHTANIGERSRTFRAERFAQIAARETPAPLSGSILLIVHAIPYASIGNDSLFDIRKAGVHQNLVRPFYTNYGYGTYNIDGYITTVPVGREVATPAYAQLFRNGILETVHSELIGERGSYGLVFPSRAFADGLFAFIEQMRQLYAALEIPPPMSINIAFKGLTGCELGISERLTFYMGISPRPLDRDVLRLPELTLDDAGGAVEAFARPMLDALWQAAGLERCFDYDDAGGWSPK